jgi:hypothetical protein
VKQGWDRTDLFARVTFTCVPVFVHVAWFIYEGAFLCVDAGCKEKCERKE